MRNRKFNVHKKKQQRNILKKFAITFFTVLLLALPIQTSLSGLSLLGFESNVAHAQSLNEINLLSSTNTEAGTTGTMGNNTFYVNISGDVASNINLMKNDQVFNVHLDLGEIPDNVREKVEIASADDGQVTITFSPINFTLISTDLTDSFNFTSDVIEMGSVKLLELINDLVSLPLVGHLVKVQGVDEYVKAYQEFTQLRYETQKIPDYHGSAPISVNNDTDTVSFEFTHEIQRHVTTSIKDRVLHVANNLQDAIDNIKIELFPGVPLLNKLTFLMEGIHFVLDKMTESINSRLLEPLEAGVLDGSGVSNNLGIKGQLNASTTLQINNAIGICDGIESVGQGTYSVTVRGLATNQVVTSSDLFYDLNAADDVTVIVLPHQNCLTGTTVGPALDYGDRFNIGGIQGVEQYIDPADLLDLEEEIEENKKAQEEADIEAAKELAREMKGKRHGDREDNGLQVERDKEARNTTQRQADSEKDDAEKADEAEDEKDDQGDDTDKADDDQDADDNDGEGLTRQFERDQPGDRLGIDSGNKARNTQQRTESPGDKADDAEKARDDKADKGDEADEKADDDAKADGDDQQTAGDDNKKAGDDAQDADGSKVDIDIDMDEIEEGIGLLQRLLEIIMKIIEALTNKN